MKPVTLLCLLLAAAGAPAVAHADDNALAAAAAATVVINATDAAYNAKDVAAMTAQLDKDFFAQGPMADGGVENLENFRATMTRLLKGDSRLVRDKLTMRASPAGDVVWYVADYTITSGGVGHKLRESGVVVKRGRDWKIAMWHASAPKEPAAAAKPR